MSSEPLLYTSPGSQHCRRVALLIHEGALPVETRIVDVRPPGMGGENEGAAFLKLNPNAKVPVLTHRGHVVTESNAIMVYLCEHYGLDVFWPGDLARRSEVLAWQFWQSAQLSPSADGLMVEHMLKPMLGLEPDPVRVQELTDAFHRWSAVLDATLAGQPFVCGDSLTCADFSIAGALMYRHAARLPVGEHAALAGWLKRMQQRDSWQATEPPSMDPASG